MALNKERAARAAGKLRSNFEDDDFEDDLPAMDAEGFDPNAPEEFTDEDAQQSVAEASDAQRDAINRSRQRGRAPRDESRGHRTTDARMSREREDHDFAYRPLNSLDAPPPRPGMEQRWVRITLGDKNDVRNWSKQTRYHWKPRMLETVPNDFNPPTQQVAGLGDVIMVNDLVLCERDARYGRSRRKFFAEQHKKQVAATRRHVQKVERDDHPIKVTDRDAAPTVGRGRRVRAQDDE
jgi:hypothetical protein